MEARKTTETWSKATRERIRDHVGKRHRCLPPPGSRLHKSLGRVRKELASCFYQSLSGHTATGEHLVGVGQALDRRQIRYHLFFKFRRWMPEIRRLWERVGRDCQWESSRALQSPSFRDEQATPALLESLDGMRAGRMPGLALSRFEEDEEGLDEFVLWPQSGEEDRSGESGEEDDPGPS